MVHLSLAHKLQFGKLYKIKHVCELYVAYVTNKF